MWCTTCVCGLGLQKGLAMHTVVQSVHTRGFFWSRFPVATFGPFLGFLRIPVQSCNPYTMGERKRRRDPCLVLYTPAVRVLRLDWDSRIAPGLKGDYGLCYYCVWIMVGNGCEKEWWGPLPLRTEWDHRIPHRSEWWFRIAWGLRIVLGFWRGWWLGWIISIAQRL